MPKIKSTKKRDRSPTKNIYVHAASLLFIVFVILGFFWKSIVHGYVTAPTDALVGLYHPWRDLYHESYERGVPFKNPLTTDPVRQQIPWKKSVIDSWSRKEIPAYNPYDFSGTSLIGNSQAAAWYPLNIYFFVFDFVTAWQLLIISQMILGALFFYMLLTQRGFHPIARVLGSIMWTFSGFNIAWLTWGTMVQTILWVPLVLWCIDRLFLYIYADKSLRSQILYGCLGMFGCICMITAGHLQIALYGYALLSLYALTKYFWGNTNRASLYTYIGWGMFIFGGSLVISSVQWIQSYQAIVHSSRFTADTINTPGFFLPWQHSVQFMFPDFFGNPATGNYWGVWNYGEFIGYIGIVGLFFALYGIVLGWKTRWVRWWVGILCGSLLFALPSPLSRLPYVLHIPFLASLQPTRLMALTDISLVLLSTFGIHMFLQSHLKYITHVSTFIFFIVVFAWGYVLQLYVFLTPMVTAESMHVAKRNMIIPTIVCMGLLFLFFIRKISKGKYTLHIISGIMVMMVIGDLLRFGWKFTPITPREYFFPETPVTKFLSKQQKPFRVMSLDDRLFAANTLGYFGIESISGYDPIYNARYEEFIAAMERGEPNIQPPFGFNRIIQPKNIQTPLFPLLNVRYVLSLQPVNRADFREVLTYGETHVYEYLAAIPRAYLVTKVVLAEMSEQQIKELYEPTFDNASMAVVEKHLDVGEYAMGEMEKVEFVEYAGNKITMKVWTNANRLLAISQVFDDNWEVRIDGIRSNLERINYTFMGVVVPTGEHTVDLMYKPSFFGRNL